METSKTYRSSEAIDMVLSAIGLTRESLSTYKEYTLTNGSYIRLRISNHGIFLQNWFDANKEKRADNPSTPKLNIGQNLAITFAPNEEECIELNIPFPPKIKNVTVAKTDTGKNVKPQFTIRHIAYFTWKLSTEDIEKISAALSLCVTNGSVYSEPLKDTTKYVEWEDTSNLPPKKITESNTHNNMKKNTIKLNEQQLRNIVAESTNKVLKEDYVGTDWFDENPNKGVYSEEFEVALNNAHKALNVLLNASVKESTQVQDINAKKDIERIKEGVNTCLVRLDRYVAGVRTC